MILRRQKVSHVDEPAVPPELRLLLVGAYRRVWRVGLGPGGGSSAAAHVSGGEACARVMGARLALTRAHRLAELPRLIHLGPRRNAEGD